MMDMQAVGRRGSLFIRNHWFVFFAIITYLLFTIYYMGPSTTIFDCSNTVNGFGDNTAGPIWKASNAGETPVGGFVRVTNYPSGESLGGPVDTVVVGQSTLMWAMAKIAGPVCGYNLTNMLGYISSALVMCGFIYSLTRGRRWIAWLAGYAVAFTPYFQVKVGGHPSYGFAALLIGVMWAFLMVVRTRKKSYAALFALLIAICFYFDPYFSLLASTIVGPLSLVWLLVRYVQLRKDKKQKNQFIAESKALGLSLLLVVAAIIPLPIVMTSQSSQISSFVAGTRDDVVGVATACSNLPHEYLLPFPHSPLFKLLGDNAEKAREALYAFSKCGLGEDVVGISLVMMTVVILFFIILCWEKVQRRKIGASQLLAYDPRIVIIGTLAVAFMAVMLALPPMRILGLPLPSYLLVEATSIWRIIAREYVIVNIAITVLFSVALVYFTSVIRMKRIVKALLYLSMFLLMFIQYQTYHPFSGNEANRFSYSKAPTGYTWLKQQSDIHAIAEYPIEKAAEANSHGYYLTMQSVHGKPLLNSALPNSPDDTIRSSIKNLADPQTVPTLHALGIGAIVVHGVELADLEKIPYLQVVFKGDHKPDGRLPDTSTVAKDTLFIVRIAEDAPLPRTSLQFLGSLPRNLTIQPTATRWEYELVTNTRIALRQLPPAKDGVVQDELCFMVKMAAVGDSGDLFIKDSKTTRMTIPLSDTYRFVSLATTTVEELNLISSNGHNMRMEKIGCVE